MLWEPLQPEGYAAHSERRRARFIVVPCRTANGDFTGVRLTRVAEEQPLHVPVPEAAEALRNMIDIPLGRGPGRPAGEPEMDALLLLARKYAEVYEADGFLPGYPEWQHGAAVARRPEPDAGPPEVCAHCGLPVYWCPDGWKDEGGGFSCSARPTGQPATFGMHELTEPDAGLAPGVEHYFSLDELAAMQAARRRLLQERDATDFPEGSAGIAIPRLTARRHFHDRPPELECRELHELSAADDLLADLRSADGHVPDYNRAEADRRIAADSPGGGSASERAGADYDIIYRPESKRGPRCPGPRGCWPDESCIYRPDDCASR